MYPSAAVAPGSPAARWEGAAPRRRSSRPPAAGTAAAGPGPLPAAPLGHRSSPARPPCSPLLPPRGLSGPGHKAQKGLPEPVPVGGGAGRRRAYGRDVGLVLGAAVVGHEGVELERVQLEAGVVDVLDILRGVFVHGQQGGGLEGQKSKTHHNLKIYIQNGVYIVNLPQNIFYS